MSGEGPESVPTSADPRSKRPLKRRALTPVSAQAAELDSLFARPDQPIRVPPTQAEREERARAMRAAPPEIVTNVQGSSAGAGSGEFHVYKASRRREQERLRLMDVELRREQQKSAFEKAREENERRDEERTRKNREKREKAKARKAKGGQGQGQGQGQAPRPAANGGKVNGADAGDKDDERGQSGQVPVAARRRDTSSAGDGDGSPGPDGVHDGSRIDSTLKPSVVEPSGLLIHDDD